MERFEDEMARREREARERRRIRIEPDAAPEPMPDMLTPGRGISFTFTDGSNVASWPPMMRFLAGFEYPDQTRTHPRDVTPGTGFRPIDDDQFERYRQSRGGF